MRILLYTLALAVLPMLAQANHIERDLEGYWDNYQTHTTIRVKAKRYGFKIKGIYGDNRWTKFRRNHRGQYRDSRGNKLVIRSHNRIEFVNRYSRLVTPFMRHGRDRKSHRRYRNNYRYKQYDYYGDGYQYGQDNGSGYYNEDYSDYQGGYYRGDDRNGNRERSADNREPNILNFTPMRIDSERLRALEGTWRSKGNSGKKVIIVSTRDGIKVKDTTNDKWYRYRLSSDLKSLTDDRGNQYQLEQESLFWIAADGKSVLRLEKKSNTTF